MSDHIEIPGWTIAGSMWGQNAWLRVNDRLLLALGQGEDEFLCAPFDENEPTKLVIFRGDLGDWSLDDVYAVDAPLPVEYGGSVEFHDVIYPDLRSALAGAALKVAAEEFNQAEDERVEGIIAGAKAK